MNKPIEAELQRAKKLHPCWPKNMYHQLAILSEECGEVAKAVNDYNQDGDYFVCTFDDKPTFQDLKKALPHENDVTIGKLTMGGGRQDIEENWYYLTEMKNGEVYES